VVRVPTRYGGVHGPDLADVARLSGLPEGEVVRRHAAPVYRVHFLGFTPGFPYLGGLDPRLATPRLDSPRARIPAGSVAIGGVQTGVYPVESPGGWRIVGRTPLRLFDPRWPAPFLLAPGDGLRFVPVDDAAFDAIAAEVLAGRRAPEVDG
jgi:KipI family sensor histidine kinase inhibitor